MQSAIHGTNERLRRRFMLEELPELLLALGFNVHAAALMVRLAYHTRKSA